MLELSGERYLIASRGNTQLVRNSRATGEGRLQRGSRVETFEPDRERPEVWRLALARQLKRYEAAVENYLDGL